MSAGYGDWPVLHRVAIHVSARETVGIIGSNAAGKSTLLRVIAGLLPAWGGWIAFDDHDITTLSTSQRRHIGVSYVPQGRRVFAKLTVAEQLLVASQVRADQGVILSTDRIQELLPEFPPLSAQTEALSGGQQKLLAIACGLVASPRVLLLDEPWLGVREEVMSNLFVSLRALQEETGLAVVVVEHRVRQLADVCERYYAFRQGSIVHEGDAAELRDDERLRAIYFDNASALTRP